MDARGNWAVEMRLNLLQRRQAVDSDREPLRLSNFLHPLVLWSEVGVEDVGT